MSRRSEGTKTEYTEKSFTRLKGLEGVRARPTMYLGERGPMMVFQMLKEFFDNAVDEARAGTGAKGLKVCLLYARA